MSGSSDWTLTPNYGLYKPTFNADNDAWGGHWNQNADVIDAQMKANATATAAPAVIAGTPPVAAAAGALWFDNVGGQLYVRYDDGTSVQWVPAANMAGGASQTDVATALNNVGRNKLHNSMFNVAQRGAGPWTGSGYTADRWYTAISLDTSSVSMGQYSDANRTAIGDEEAINFLSVGVTGNAGAGAFTLLHQPIENVRRLANKTVTVSFWANSTAGTPKVGVQLRQYFGTGGSPSAFVDLNATPVTISGAQVRYSVTITLPSISGKALGTNGDHYTRLALWLSSGATNNALSGGIGVQTATFVFWGIQREIAQPGQTQPTPLEKPDPVLQLQQCQRFFRLGRTDMQGGAYTAGVTAFAKTDFGTTMRANPTVVAGTGTNTNVSGLSVGPLNSDGVYASATATATGNWSILQAFTASADL
jgi:hypothetical protein